MYLVLTQSKHKNKARVVPLAKSAYEEHGAKLLQDVRKGVGRTGDPLPYFSSSQYSSTVTECSLTLDVKSIASTDRDYRGLRVWVNLQRPRVSRAITLVLY
jgi:hypothetical protein